VKVVILGGHWRDGDDAEIEETVQRIQSLGMTPILMGPIPEYDSALPRLLALSIQTSHPELPGQHREQNLVALDRKLAFLSEHRWHIKYFSFADALCPDGRCREYATPLVPLQEDATHLTGAGSRLVAEILKQDSVLD
jgi:hypothetical protein